MVWKRKYEVPPKNNWQTNTDSPLRNTEFLKWARDCSPTRQGGVATVWNLKFSSNYEAGNRGQRSAQEHSYLLAQRLAENSDKPVGKRQNLGWRSKAWQSSWPVRPGLLAAPASVKWLNTRCWLTSLVHLFTKSPLSMLFLPFKGRIIFHWAFTLYFIYHWSEGQHFHCFHFFGYCKYCCLHPCKSVGTQVFISLGWITVSSSLYF